MVEAKNIINLSKQAFWDVDIENIDFESKANYIIRKVFDFGSTQDILETLAFYGDEKVKFALTTAPYLMQKSMVFASKFFSNSFTVFQMLYYETVSPNLLIVLRKLMGLPELTSFRLVGGTALSLQIGHRKSIDIDLFTDKDFDTKSLQNTLHENFVAFEIRWQNRNGFVCSIEDIKVDFINWYTTFVKGEIIEDGIRLAEKEEIAAMKFEAITSRKEKKDFIDIAFLLQEFELQQLLSIFKQRYPFISSQLVLESLMSIDFADEAEEPTMLVEHDWQTTKQLIIDTVNNYLLEQKKLVVLAQQARIKSAEDLIEQKKKGK